MDTIGTIRIEAARKAKNLPPVAQVGRPAKYIVEAEQLGLGIRDQERIDHHLLEG